jgi:hypothetical protein
MEGKGKEGERGRVRGIERIKKKETKNFSDSTMRRMDRMLKLLISTGVELV